MKTIIFTLLTFACTAQGVTYLLPANTSAVITNQGKSKKVKCGKPFVLDFSKSYTVVTIENGRREEWVKMKGSKQLIKN